MKVTRPRIPKVHYAYVTLSGRAVAFCAVITRAIMYRPRLHAESGQVTCRLCIHHLGRRGAPIP
jgi:hypothetical protein